MYLVILSILCHVIQIRKILSALDVEYISPTLEGMVTLSDDKKSVEIGISGLYRVIAELNYTSYSTGCTADRFQIKLNGTVVVDRYAGRTSGFGTMTHTLDAKKGDKIMFYCNCMHTTSANWNSFTIQKL